MNERQTLLKKISEISFCLNDLTLFLDTHPTDKQAMELFETYQNERAALLNNYAEQFEPLTFDCVDLQLKTSADAVTNYPDKQHFTWVDGPAPWEGGLV